MLDVLVLLPAAIVARLHAIATDLLAGLCPFFKSLDEISKPKSSSLGTIAVAAPPGATGTTNAIIEEAILVTTETTIEVTHEETRAVTLEAT